MGETTDIDAGSPSLNLAVERSIANFINQQGNQKWIYLLDATEMLKQYSIVNSGEEYTIKKVNEELSKVKLSRIKDYNKLIRYLEKVRKKLNHCQMLYEDMKNSKDVNIKKKFRKEIANTTTPFQIELIFLFMVLLKISGVQNKTISRELLRTPEESKIKAQSFDKKPKEEKVI